MPTRIDDSETGWFVIRTRPKSEHIAGLHLQKFAQIEEVFAPRVRFQKATQRGKVWFVEALFPGYIFARFELAERLRAVNATNAVSGVLRFNDVYPKIGDSFIKDLQKEFPSEKNELRVIEQDIREGDEVVVIDGSMAGLETIVTKIMSSDQRVKILLDWLGEEREVDINSASIIPVRQARGDIKS